MKKSKLILTLTAVASTATLVTPIVALATSCFGSDTNTDFYLIKTSTGYCIDGLKATDRTKITSIVVPESINGTKVVEISKGAFKGCTNLESITLPFIGHTYSAKGKGGLFGYVFGDEMYEGCGGYTWQEYSDNEQYEATDVEYAQYAIPSTLKSVTITNATTIPSGAFSNCRYLRDIKVTSTTNDDFEIGNYAFYCCRLLRAFDIPSNTKVIGRKAFQGCYNLKQIAVPTGVEQIKHNAFASCISATTASIPSTVEYMGKLVFENFVSGVVTLEDDEETASSKPYWDDEWIPSNVSIVYEYSSGGLFYTSNAIVALCGKESTGYYGSIIQYTGDWNQTEIEVPGTFEANGSLYEIKNIGPNVFNGYSNTIKFILPDTITSISANAFQDCTALTHVKFSNNLERIGSEAFIGCNSLCGHIEGTSTLVNGFDFKHVKVIGARAFKEIESITTINFGDSLETIYDSAFEDCHGLAPLRIKNSETKEIESHPLIFPKTLKYIGNSAFKNACKYIPSTSEILYQTEADVVFESGNENTIEFSESCFENFGVRNTTTYPRIINVYIDFNDIKVNEFADYTFYNSNMYGMYNFPKNVQKYGAYSFCTTNTYWAQSKTTLTNAKEFKIYTDKTVSIGDYAFCDFNHASIEFTKSDAANEDTLLTIGKRAFQSCNYAGDTTKGYKGTVEFNIPDKVESIGEWAFYNCTALRKSNLPNNSKFTRLENGVFNSCTNLGIDQQSYDADAFIVPAYVTYIVGSTFNGCQNLKYINVKGKLTYLGGSTFANCKSLAHSQNNTCLVFDDNLASVTSFGGSMYSGCTQLVYAPFPTEGNNAITSIPGYCFDGCGNLSNFKVLKSITSIGDGAFRKCYGFTAVTGMEAVKTIGKYAFYECKYMTSFDMPSACHTICDNAFAYCTELGKDASNPFVLPTDITQAWTSSSGRGMGSNPFLGWTSDQTIHFTKYNLNNPEGEGDLVTRWGWTLKKQGSGNDVYYTCSASGSDTVKFVYDK